MLKIYGIPTINTLKVVLTAEQLELPYEYVQLDFSKQEQKTPEHLARHPLGRVPAIEHDGNFLCESNAISVYLADVTGSTLYNGDSYHKARIHQWIDMLTLHMGRWIGQYYFENYIKKVFLNGTPDPENLEEAKGFLDIQLPVLDKVLSDNEFLCGEQMTVADLVGFVLINAHELGNYDISPHAGICRWHEQIKALPAWRRTTEKMGLGD